MATGNGSVGRPPPDPELIAEAWRLKWIEGQNYRYIAGKLGVSVGTAHEWVSLADEQAHYVTEMELREHKLRALARLEHYRSVLFTEFQGRHIKPDVFVRTNLSVDEREARILGYDAAIKVETSNPDVKMDPGIVAALAAIKADNDRTARAIEQGEDTSP